MSTYTYEQAMNGLAFANRVRQTNAKLLRDISGMSQVDGIDVVMDVLHNGDETGPVGALKILRLLCAPRGMGEEKAGRLLKEAGVLTGDRKLRELTTRQRAVIVWHLENPDVLWPRTTLLHRRHLRAVA